MNKLNVLSERMKEFAEKLNLKSHLDRHGKLMLHSATDLEGHLGKDGIKCDFRIVCFGFIE